MDRLGIGKYVRIQTDEPESAFNGTWGIFAGYGTEFGVKLPMIRVQGQTEAIPFDRSELTVISEQEAEAIAARERANGEI